MTAWRPADDALLARLEDERLLERLWTFESGGAPALPPRASGMLGAFRAWREGVPDDLAALGAALRPRPLRDAPPAFLHHLAVYEERLADALRGDPSRWVDRRTAALAAWLALAQEGDYLRRIGEVQFPEGGEDVARSVWRRPLRVLGEAARRDAPSLGTRGQWAMRGLAHVGQACEAAGCAAGLRAEVEAAAERLRTEAVEAALAPVSDAIADATARGVAEQEGPKIAHELASIWRWTDLDEHVERFAVDELTPMAWNVYQREPGYDNLRAIVTPLEPLVDSLAERLARDPMRIAYAAPVAQIYVFRAEMATLLGAQRSHAERAVAICPTHRNGRLILARTLAYEVRGSLDRGMLATMDKDALKKKIERARELYPRTKGLDELERRVDELGWWKRWGG